MSERSSHREHRGYTEVTERFPELRKLTEQIIGSAIEVHRELGPGLLESAYQRALAHELMLRGVVFEQQKLCPVRYKDLIIDDAYRLDFLVGGLVVVELKTVDALEDVHSAQVLTYLKFSQCRIGLLMNFRSTLLTHGLRRLAL
jgi:GxxExxY protein